MTEVQFLIILATVWIAPHANKTYSYVIGSIALIAAVCVPFLRVYE
jgi:hypothetical protein